MRGNYFRFRFSLIWEGIRSFGLFLKRIPGFIRLNRFWDKEPQFYWDVISNYTELMYNLTDGALSKPGYTASFVEETIEEQRRKAEEYADGGSGEAI